MAWATYTDERGRGWEADPVGIAHLIRSSEYNRQLVKRSKVVRGRDGFLGPMLVQVETDFGNIRGATSEEARGNIRGATAQLGRGSGSLFEHLVRVREDSEAAATYYRGMVRGASQETAANIGSNVDNWENALTVTKAVRDLSATSLLVGATVVSGGLAVGLAGGGAVTFLGSAEDSYAAGNTFKHAIGDAAVTTSFTLVTTVLVPKALGPISKAASGMGGKVVVGMLTAQSNIVGEVFKSSIMADRATTQAARDAAKAALTRRLGARTATEITTMVFGAWLESRGIPAMVVLEKGQLAANMLVNGGMSTLADRVVDALAEPATSEKTARDLDLAMAEIDARLSAEQFVRASAMRPAS